MPETDTTCHMSISLDGATGTGGSGKWYLYNSLEGSSVKAAATTPSPATRS